MLTPLELTELDILIRDNGRDQGTLDTSKFHSTKVPQEIRSRIQKRRERISVLQAKMSSASESSSEKIHTITPD